jgi:hypothetical protein
MAKLILSKDTYFNKRDLKYTLADWEAFKVANPRSEYTSEVCWALHDSMIERNKPATDSMAIIKLLLKELNIEFVASRNSLKITSDLSGQTIMVLDIESDELLEQLEAAGATVIYITSNVNYGWKVPEMYFDMYPENYSSNDFPAVDKRNLFTGKNIIVKYVNFYDYKNDLNKLYNIIKEINMQINKVLMNPPYNGNLHLKVLDTTVKAVRQNNPNCEVVSIQPARWLEDSTAPYKSGSDYKAYKDSIFNKLSKLQLVDATTSCKAFNIMNSTDLGIYTFNLEHTAITINLQETLVSKLLTKILDGRVLKERVETKAVAGYRCEVKEMASGTGGHNLGNFDSSKIADVNIIWGPYSDGYTKDGKFFTETRQKNQFTKSYFAYSILFTTLDEADNFYKSCNTKFYRRLVQLLKWDVHVPLSFLPYMEDYSKVWTDEDYCKFFDLTEEESEFMCRTVDDYRVKDFINYISLED